MTAGALAATVSWGTAIEVPGTAALNVGRFAEVTSVSCVSRGNCAASGVYSGQKDNRHAFVVNERNGAWGTAVKVLIGRHAYLYSISCATAGSCVAGGAYTRRHKSQAFVVNERNGVWGGPIKVPGMARLNLGGNAAVFSVSCATAGSCAAGGYYYDGFGDDGHAFVVNEKYGVWRKAKEVPGTAALLNRGGLAEVDSVSCARAGSCAAGGYYVDRRGSHAFVVNEKNGVWREAKEVPGTAALNVAGDAEVTSVSCATARSCAAGGYYSDGSGNLQAFVVNEKNGVWRKAKKVPGTAALNLGGARVNSVSCAKGGFCAAGGRYTDGSGNDQAFVANAKNGVWRKAIEVPGSAALNLADFAGVNSVSCGTAGSCAAGGYYTDGSRGRQAFVASETNGVWSDAIEVPGAAALNIGSSQSWRGAEVQAISCATASSCAAAGYYTDAVGHSQAFVTAP